MLTAKNAKMMRLENVVLYGIPQLFSISRPITSIIYVIYTYCKIAYSQNFSLCVCVTVTRMLYYTEYYMLRVLDYCLRHYLKIVAIECSM